MWFGILEDKEDAQELVGRMLDLDAIRDEIEREVLQAFKQGEKLRSRGQILVWITKEDFISYRKNVWE